MSDPSPHPPLPWPEPESARGWRRWLVILACLAIVVLYTITIFRYYAGAMGGVDQAGYLMTARLIAGEANIDNPTTPAPPTLDDPEHPKATSAQRAFMFNWLRNRLSFVPESPFQFASRMCVMTEPYGPADPDKPAEYRIYAKYPFGFPLLAAIARSIGGWTAMYLVNPLATILAIFAAYFLFRQVASPFMAMLGMLWLACNPLVLCYANDANSHATTLLCVVVGFWGLLSWMQTGKISRAWIGGLALGYACTIRYSEFLLVLPLLFAAIVQFRPNKKQVIGTLSLLVAWAIPIAILAFICWVSFGSPWKTGYTYCNESTGFGWKYFTGNFGDPMVRKVPNWETFLQQLNRTALFVLWVPALLGLLAMFGSAWRLGITIALWILPQTILYMFYYWAPGGEANVSYMRFVMTLMPGFILAAIWFLDRCKTTSRVPVVLAAGVITAVGCGMNLRNIAPQVESRHLQSTSLRQTIDMTQKLLDPGSVIFGDDQLLNLLDCVGDWKLVNVQMFSPTTFASSLRQIESANPEQENDDDSVEPHPVQRHRLKFQMELLGRQDADGKWTVKPFEELRAYQNAKLDRYFAQGRRIAFMTAGPPPTLPPRRDYELKVLGRWSPPVPVTEPTINPAMRFGRPPQQPGGQPGGRRMPPGQGGVVRAMPNRLGGSVALYELVKKAEPIPVQERMRRRAAEERGSNTGTGGGGELFPNVPAQ